MLACAQDAGVCIDVTMGPERCVWESWQPVAGRSMGMQSAGSASCWNWRRRTKTAGMRRDTVLESSW